ncbi:TrkA C-terminal domain-containing protein [Kamptonema cortianum]|nr:TrkA C-terminal domain-containing protein [Geitlerinema splendidum]MDK3155921.1 TrkA C-terminal domain-containing protein [Kamptonema cortianum]
MFPETDIRERLSLQTGYDVAELVVPDTPEFRGKSIRESGIREKDIVVLTVERPGLLLQNPRSTFLLEAGDKLLCFGKHENMRALIPARVRRKRKVKPVLPK